MRLLKILAILLGSLLGVLVLAVVAINVIPGNQFRGPISAAVKSATGRELAIGDLDLELGSRFRVAASDVSLSNADWGSRPQMFTGRLIEGEVALKPLLDGVVDLRLVLEAPDLLLEKNADGRGNWQMGAGPPDQVPAEADAGDEGDSGLLRPLIREVRLEQVRLAYLDAQAAEQHEADFETVLLRSHGNQVEMKLDGRLDDHPLTLTGGIDDTAVTDADAPADFSLTGALGDIALSAHGTLDAISATARADLLLEVKAPSLATLSAFAGRDLPDQGPLDASLRVTGSEGRYSAQDIKVKLGAELLTAAVAGAITDLTGMGGIDLAVSAKTDRTAELVKQFGLELPVEPPPSLDAEAKIAGSLKALALPSYRVGVKDDGVEATVKGQVANAIALTGIEADIDLAAQSLAALSKYAATELPDSGPVELKGELSSPQGFEAPSEVSAVLSGDGVAAKASGSVGNLLTANDLALAVDVAGDSLRQVARLAGLELTQTAPLELNVQLSSGDKTYQAEKLRVALGESEMTGTLTFTQPAKAGGKAALQGKLHLGQWDLEALAGGDEGKPAEADRTATPPQATPGDVADREAGSAAKSDKIFPSDPLPVEALRSLDVDLDITADELGTTTLLLEQLVAKLTLSNGVLRFEPVNARVGDGNLKASSVLDASTSPPTLAVDIDMDNGTSRRFGGRYSLDVDLDGTGDSVAQLMAGLDGQAILDVRDMELEKSLMTGFGQGLLETINPFTDEAEKPKLVCAIVRFDIEDGIADAEDKIVAQFVKVTWFGGGTVDLKTEALDLGAQSKPRTGLGIDTTAGLPGLVHIGGTLAAPKIVPDPEGMAKTYGNAYLTVVTGGLYLLVKGLWDKNQANADVCAEILARREEGQGRPVAEDPTTDASAEPAAAKEQPSSLDILESTE